MLANHRPCPQSYAGNPLQQPQDLFEKVCAHVDQGEHSDADVRLAVRMHSVTPTQGRENVPDRDKVVSACVDWLTDTSRARVQELVRAHIDSRSRLRDLLTANHDDTDVDLAVSVAAADGFTLNRAAQQLKTVDVTFSKSYKLTVCGHGTREKSCTDKCKDGHKGFSTSVVNGSVESVYNMHVSTGFSSCACGRRSRSYSRPTGMHAQHATEMNPSSRKKCWMLLRRKCCKICCQGSA